MNGHLVSDVVLPACLAQKLHKPARVSPTLAPASGSVFVSQSEDRTNIRSSATAITTRLDFQTASVVLTPGPQYQTDLASVQAEVLAFFSGD